MSHACAERCGLSRLIDARFAGIAKGVGTSKILGRIHLVQLQIANQFLPCSLTVLEDGGGTPDMLLGLDMLMRHQFVIDLHQKALLINGEAIPFLAECDIPKGDA